MVTVFDEPVLGVERGAGAAGASIRGILEFFLAIGANDGVIGLTLGI